MKPTIQAFFFLVALFFGASQGLNAQVFSLGTDTVNILQSDTDPELFFVDITAIGFSNFLGVDVTFKVSGATLDSIETLIPGESFLTADIALADTARRLSYGADEAIPITLADGTPFLRLWIRGDLTVNPASLEICIAEAVIDVNGVPEEAEFTVEIDLFVLLYNPTRNFGGRVSNPLGNPLGGVPIQVSWGDSSRMVMTDNDGNYSFAELPIAESYIISPLGYPTESSRAERIDGVNVADLTFLSRHFLGIQPFTSNWQLLAAEVTGDNEVSLVDILTIQSYILLRVDDFGPLDYWRFYPANFEFGEDPLSPAPPATITLDGMPSSSEGLDFIGLKRGDVNGSGSE